jgi:hypothetical protein
MREIAERVDSGAGDGWPFNANATSFSATITWEKMEPGTGGNVFVSNFLNEGCGSGYVGAQMHYNESKMYADWAIWDVGPYTTALPMSDLCVRYDGEGHGTQCGVEPGHEWEIGTAYTFNVTLVGSNASGAHFAGFVKNNRTGDIYKLGEIFTKPPTSAYNCSRLLVASSPFQEVYSGGKFENVVSVQGPTFRGVEHHPSDVNPTGATNCYYHHSCYGKDGPANCRNESSSFCLPPNCSIATTTFVSGHTPVPPKYIAPWDKNPDAEASNACAVQNDTGLTGGLVPEIWGAPGMNIIWPAKAWPQYCCWYCVADPDCVAAQLIGMSCSLHHNSTKYGPIKPVPNKGLHVLTPKRAGLVGMFV